MSSILRITGSPLSTEQRAREAHAYSTAQDIAIPHPHSPVTADETFLLRTPMAIVDRTRNNNNNSSSAFDAYVSRPPTPPPTPPPEQHQRQQPPTPPPTPPQIMSLSTSSNVTSAFPTPVESSLDVISVTERTQMAIQSSPTFLRSRRGFEDEGLDDDDGSDQDDNDGENGNVRRRRLRHCCCHLMFLPAEILLEILSYSSVRTLVVSRATCRRFLALATHNRLWYPHYLDTMELFARHMPFDDGMNEDPAPRPPMPLDVEPGTYYLSTTSVYRRHFGVRCDISRAPLSAMRQLVDAIHERSKRHGFALAAVFFVLLIVHSVVRVIPDFHLAALVIVVVALFSLFTVLTVYVAVAVAVTCRYTPYRDPTAAQVVGNFCLASLVNYWMCALLASLQWSTAVSLSWILVGSPIIANSSIQIAMLALTPCDPLLGQYARDLFFSVCVVLPPQCALLLHFARLDYPHSVPCWASAIPVYLQVAAFGTYFVMRLVLLGLSYRTSSTSPSSSGAFAAPSSLGDGGSASFPPLRSHCGDCADSCVRVSAHTLALLVIAVLGALGWASCESDAVVHAVLVVLWSVAATLCVLMHVAHRSPEFDSSSMMSAA
eukprot:PhM_4_TR9757/c0_g1_i1/m.35392